MQDSSNEISELEVMFNKAASFAASGDAQNAITWYDKATAAAPNLHAAWFNKAIVYEHQLKDYDKAVQCYLRAAYIKPTDLDASRSIGVLYFRTHQFNKARYWLQKMINWGENHPSLIAMRDECERHAEESPLVFISYAWKTKDQVKSTVLPKLNDAGVEYFIDEERIPQDDDLPEIRWQIEQLLAASDTVLLVWSEFASRSFYVDVELCASIGMIKNIVPLMLDGCQLPDPIRSAVKKGTVAPVYSTSGQLAVDLTKALKHRRVQATNVLKANVFAQTVETYHKEVRFDWIKLDGGVLPDFLVARYPVTQEQWKALMGVNPSQFHGDDSRPVESVSWHDVQEFINRFKSSTDLNCRLLTNSEWEFACRAGSVGNWCCGDDEHLLLDFAWSADNTGRGSEPELLYFADDSGKTSQIVTSPHYTNSVYTKMPNRWNIYHMHGNVYEWCDNDYIGSPGHKSIRGGSFTGWSRSMRCSAHEGLPANARFNNVGFRLCAQIAA